jgi:SpoVK/Ycf46/Vps4 family AAA+-type ATPase
MPYTTALSTRRWDRLGRGLADFALSLILASLSHLGVASWRAARWLLRMICSGLHRRAHKRGVIQATVRFAPVCSESLAPIADIPNGRFEHVAGLEAAKRENMLRMILPLQHAREARTLRLRLGGGLLLYGPPGTGKTLLVQAVANELHCPFYHIRPSDIMSGQVGEAEKAVHRLFERLRSLDRAVLFLAEVEALIPSRRRKGSTIMARVVAQLLAGVEGLGSNHPTRMLLLIGATNEPGMLDPAILRPGRFDIKVYVGPRDGHAREQIIRLNLKGGPLANDVDLSQLVEITNGKSGAEIRDVVGNAADRAFLRSVHTHAHAASLAITIADFTGDTAACKPPTAIPPSCRRRSCIWRPHQMAAEHQPD